MKLTIANGHTWRTGARLLTRGSNPEGGVFYFLGSLSQVQGPKHVWKIHPAEAKAKRTGNIRKVRKGMTIVEVVVSLLLMALAVIVMGRLTETRIIESESLNYQYTMQAADGMLYSIFKDFHECRDYTITHDINASSDTDIFTIAFDMGDAGAHIYAYDQYNYTFYYNGATQFKCEDFMANGDRQHLYVSMKLANGERLEYTIYR